MTNTKNYTESSEDTILRLDSEEWIQKISLMLSLKILQNDFERVTKRPVVMPTGGLL